MARQKNSLRLVLLVIITISLPGPILWGSYYILTSLDIIQLVGITRSSSNLAPITAGFSFTLLGFLAAVITIIYSLGDKWALLRYSESGNMVPFFFVYYYTLLILGMTFFFSLVAASQDAPEYWIVWAVIFSVNGFFQVSVIIFILARLAHKSLNPTNQMDDAGTEPERPPWTEDQAHKQDPT